MQNPPSSESPSRFWRSTPGTVLGMLLVIGLFYLVREHFAHVSQALPYLILLLCPLMHLLGHHHGGHGASQRPGNSDPQQDEKRN